MAGLPPGDPQLVSMIVNHLKTQGLFDQFRRDCLADVDTKPAYLNLKQRVDNFVSNHLSNHTWSPHLNKNQLRNNIRQLVLQSGMLEQGVDRIVAQVVDPKINHTFRPHVERVVQEFLSPGSYVEVPPPVPPIFEEEKPTINVPEQALGSTPTGDAMSILDTITTLNQEASSWVSGERSQKEELVQDVVEGEQDMSLVEEGEDGQIVSDIQTTEVKVEDLPELLDSVKEEEEIKVEDEEVGSQEQAEEGKDKVVSKASGKTKEEGQMGEADPLASPSEKHHIRQKARERLKEEYSLEDSDLEGLSDITVSSVHTSDLSSLEDDSDEEVPPSESSEDGEVSSDGERVEKKQTSTDNEEDKERKPRRQAYVHKPFLYSRYYSDSDDEVTVEQRRRSAAKDKEDRLLKRQQNRERLEEKRKQRAAQLEEQSTSARKEKKVLEKKMALSRKRKRDSRREDDVLSKKKGDAEGEGKSVSSKSLQAKSSRKVSEFALSDERLRRKSGSTSEDSVEPRKGVDKSRTHSFILDLEQGTDESVKQRPGGKYDRPSRKELQPKERKDKERSLSDERSKLKQKAEKKVGGGDAQMDEPQQKEGGNGKPSSDDKGEKKTKGRSERKSMGGSREGRASVSEGVSEEGACKDTASKKAKVTCVESPRLEKDKDKEKCKENKEKDRGREEKTKGEKTSAKTDSRQLLKDSTGSSEERSDMEPAPDSSIKRKDKIPKETPKRSKSHIEDVEKSKLVEKAKSKSEGKDSEDKKPKGEHVTQESQKSNKSSWETEKDPRRSRETEPPAKGKGMEKSRSKSREDLKVASSSKLEKKGQGTEVRSKAGTPTSKANTSKDRKKEGSSKRVSEENLPEKIEDKSTKKVEKRAKIPVKKGAQTDNKRGRKGEDKSEKSSASSVPSPAPDLGDSSKESPQPKDVSTGADPTVSIVTTSVLDDTYDALSDITPEPEDGDVEERLMELEPCPLAAESDALMTLMDICTSEDARLSKGRDITEAIQGNGAPDAGLPHPELAFQDADMKMKEAALTLLSMDPDSTLSSDVVTQESHVIREETPLPPQHMETATLEEREQHVQEVLVHVPTSNASLSTSLQIATSGTSLTGVGVSKEQSPVEEGLQEDVEAAASTEDKINTTKSEREMVLSDDNQTTTHAAEFERIGGLYEGKSEEVIMEQAKTDSNNISQNEAQEETGEPVSLQSDAPEPTEVREKRRGRPPKLVKQTSNASNSDGQEEEKGSDLSEKEEKTEGRVTRKGRQSSHKASLPNDSGERKKDKESQDDPSKEDVEEANAEKATEARAPRRGRSSRTTGDEEEHPQKPEKAEEPNSRRGRRSGALAKETAASNQKEEGEMKDEEQAAETSAERPDENEQKDDEKSEPKRGGRRRKQAKPLTVHPESKRDTQSSDNKEAAEVSESREIADTRKPALKRKRSEESEEPEEGTQSKKMQEESEEEKEDAEEEKEEEAEEKKKEQEAEEEKREEQKKKKEEAEKVEKKEETEEETVAEEAVAAAGQEQVEKATQQNMVQSGTQDEEKGGDNSPSVEEEQSGTKTDEGEVDKEKTQVKSTRRGGASKRADDTEMKDKAEEKEGEPGEEEEGQDEETKRRTTTRAATRLEAERNKPAKPSTRASKLGVKEESATNTRGTRGQATVAPAKGGRKREASPPAPRTRGGPKAEEPPSKRAKR